MILYKGGKTNSFEKVLADGATLLLLISCCDGLTRKVFSSSSSSRWNVGTLALLFT